MGRESESPLFVVGVVGTVADDDVVEHIDAHGVAGLLDALRQTVVVAAGMRLARRVVVDKGHDGGIAQQGFLHDDAHVDGSL